MIPRHARAGLAAAILAGIALAGPAAMASPHSIIQVVGDFNAWNSYAPNMSQTGVSTWADTLNVPAGCSFLKFRTDFDWDGTPDYGRCSGSEGPCQIAVPADGSPLTEKTCLVTGEGQAIGEVEFPLTGSYEFLLDEDLGSFDIRYLGAPEPRGSISGTVAFSDSPPVGPVVFVMVLESGAMMLAGTGESDPADDSFVVEDLPTGVYEVWFLVSGYEHPGLPGIAVTAPGDTNVGTVTLTAIAASTKMQVVGDFNGWDTNAPLMSNPSQYVWADTLLIDAGCSLLKFRTDGQWDDDYGRCGGQEEPCQSLVPDVGYLELNVCRVSGVGVAIGEIEFPLTDWYEFVLDEQAHSCTIRAVDQISVESSTWGRIKALYRD